ncbi:SNF2 helicase associated domain-containing protein [Microvirga sp. STR05]|uniref:SNF2 helicase associated domain-containing protein n=1 Tax=Hymenobacter duratus TaxID=2771356 RepID=A0ABR8JLP7_9BACT|nr:DEAD/DEAH box helicase [Hymenobacter duratus]MBD2715464.1 SNF2 helicase associated domain-containing protein [Hymenobacter duratus]MBR7950372.1 SNF2 helicase associated domain-containing protein [Microvirga sp. STR05]
MPISSSPHPHQYLLPNLTVAELTNAVVWLHCASLPEADSRTLAAIQPETLEPNHGIFSSTSQAAGTLHFPTVEVQQLDGNLLVSCACTTPKTTLCEHQAAVLLSILHRKELRLFFDQQARNQHLRAAARDYGLEQAADLDAHFELTYVRPASVTVAPRQAALYPVTAAANQELIAQLLPPKSAPLIAPAGSRQLLVLGRHKYYGHLTLQLAEAALTATGKVKNPISPLHPLEGIWQLQSAEEIKFYTAVAHFQRNFEDTRSVATLNALRAVVQNPAGVAFYTHNATISDNITAQSISPVQLRTARTELRLTVTQRGDYYDVSGKLLLHDQPHDLQALTIRYEYFVATPEALYLLEDVAVWRVVEFFQKRNNTLLIHRSKFPEFQRDVLANLEDRLHISYGHLRPATPEQRAASGFDTPPELLLYLSDAGPSVELLPVMRYGPKEVSILSRRQLHAVDELSRPFVLARDANAEDRFVAALLKHYPEFREQLQQEALYVPKTQFLREEWFLEAFEDWRRAGITILGFNQLKKNTLNPHKARITVRVTGETNWFDTAVGVRFGQQQVTLQHLQQAVRNKRRYVQLDDGTRGILPQEWMKKFAAWFAAGHVEDDRIRTPNISFATLAELYDAEALAPSAQAQLARYRAAAADFTGIAPVMVPAGLQATLREYQRQGLNWLNFLDTFHFGGCLADDMGLGKTVQVLAFLLHLREKGHTAANLVVVPASLIFNWQAEAEKFAPSLRIHAVQGAGRGQKAPDFDAYDIVLVTYNTMVSDIQWLRDYRFNYVVLDEAQAIKNPDSQRYRAACLLQARNRLVLTGTPVENSTYDLYGQLSFACPGLLGSRQHFQDQFAAPIDKFKDGRHAQALQRKISPFVLRRTKAQVATELPAKTEMVLYCEMGAGQRRIYEACRQEFRARLLGQHPDSPRKNSAHILQGLTRLRQICNAPALLADAESYGSESAKLAVLLEEIESKAPQHKLLVFSQFVGMLDLIRPELERRGIGYQQLTGQTRNRAAAVRAFQEDDSVRVFLISLKAGGVGLNLTAADYVYLVDPWWNPAAENQAIDRAHRLGQQNKVVAVRLICPDTIEDKIRKLQEAKQELAHDLIKTDASLLKSLTPQELLELLG